MQGYLFTRPVRLSQNKMSCLFYYIKSCNTKAITKLNFDIPITTATTPFKTDRHGMSWYMKMGDLNFHPYRNNTKIDMKL